MYIITYDKNLSIKINTYCTISNQQSTSTSSNEKKEL